MRLTRVTLFLVLIIMGIGFYQLINYLLEDLETQTLQATEEVMVDTAQLLANHLENGGELGKMFEGSKDREFEAQIFQILKSQVGLNAYVTDEKGTVVFDSGKPENIGKNFSQWSDVYKTMRGSYGTRSSRTDEDDPTSSVMFVGAPIREEGKISGVVSVYKSQADVLPFVKHRRRTIIQATSLIGIGILALIVAVFIWLFRPVGRLTEYARAITRGERQPPPEVGIGREVNTLANALQTMRESLEGRQYVDRYVQTMTHELKSPLAAIQGAAELLEEDMPAADRTRFVDNIRKQSARCERLIRRLLELSALEARTHLEDSHEFDLVSCCQRSLANCETLAGQKGVSLESDLPKKLLVKGNEPLLGLAMNRLLENAIQFSPDDHKVHLEVIQNESEVSLRVSDQGDGIPDFAIERAFERFYSFRRDGEAKGNGLGLTFVKEVAELHQGTATISRDDSGGTSASIKFPIRQT